MSYDVLVCYIVCRHVIYHCRVLPCRGVSCVMSCVMSCVLSCRLGAPTAAAYGRRPWRVTGPWSSASLPRISRGYTTSGSSTPSTARYCTTTSAFWYCCNCCYCYCCCYCCYCYYYCYYCYYCCYRRVLPLLKPLLRVLLLLLPAHYSI